MLIASRFDAGGHVIEQAHLILYVADQARAERFYSAVLGITAELSVPGMTEFRLSERCVLGLMPEQGIRRLLSRLASLARANEAESRELRAELYLHVLDVDAHHAHALAAGAIELDPPRPRSWGDRASYCLDLDGYVLAFAERVGAVHDAESPNA